ncbi:MAG: hypothetical protein ACRENJ_10210 [Candidatus Eiseniibacteriota bacterium]
MKRIGYSSLTCSALLMIALAATAFATPAPNGAKLDTRVFNDCPLSTLTPTNTYPASISILDEMHPACVGFANLHSWSFSEDGGATSSLFVNGSHFRMCADVAIDGPGTGEGGLRFGPWWAPLVDGRFMINATSGEIACFGGRLPFYSFTANHGITYTKGTTVHMEMTYMANGLTSLSPATIQYQIVVGGITYNSPVLNYDEGNPAENPPYGLWGCLHDAMVGGYFQPRANTGAALTCTWSNICFENLDVVPTESQTWGRLKTLYR